MAFLQFFFIGLNFFFKFQRNRAGHVLLQGIWTTRSFGNYSSRFSRFWVHTRSRASIVIIFHVTDETSQKEPNLFISFRGRFCCPIHNVSWKHIHTLYNYRHLLVLKLFFFSLKRKEKMRAIIFKAVASGIIQIVFFKVEGSSLLI